MARPTKKDMNKSTETPSSKCPKCKQNIDVAKSVEGGHEPKPNEIVLCAYCAQILIYRSDMQLRSATSEEVNHLIIKFPKVWQEIVKATRMIQEANGKKNGHQKGRIILP